jgi:hypothetical protein
MEERERCYSFILSRTPHETILFSAPLKFVICEECLRCLCYPIECYCSHDEKKENNDDLLSTEQALPGYNNSTCWEVDRFSDLQVIEEGDDMRLFIPECTAVVV